jgi:hypothetical protein
VNVSEVREHGTDREGVTYPVAGSTPGKPFSLFAGS